MDADGAVRRARLKRTAKSCGPDTPTLVSRFAGLLAERRGQESPVPGESAKYAVKTIARGMPGDSGVTVTTCVRATLTFARKTAGASGARHSLRPLIFRRREVKDQLAQTCGEIAKLWLRMTPFEIDSVGWANAHLAPCPPSIGSTILNGGHASTFALRAKADALPTLRVARRGADSTSENACGGHGCGLHNAQWGY